MTRFLMNIGALCFIYCALMALAMGIAWSWVCTILIIIGIVRRYRKVGFYSSAYGTAEIAPEDTLRAAGMLGEKGLIIGEIGVKPPGMLSLLLNKNDVWKRRAQKTQIVRLPPTAVHVACYAPSGSGKTTGLVINNLLDSHENHVVLDYKGDL